MSFYRNIVFFAKGMTEYTKSGYHSASKSFNSSDLEADCSGHVFMITGASSGIGKEVAFELAKRRGIVHMVCRDKEKGEAAWSEITELTGNQNVYLHIVDLSEPQQVNSFAKKFSENEESLNVLINNAACMKHKREVNSEGLEVTFATNALAIHILTTRMIPLLNKSMEPRVIIVSSGGMLVQRLDAVDLQFEKMIPYDGTVAYAQTKRQEVVMTEKYAELYPGIHFSSMHPGWVDTPGVRKSMPGFFEKMQNRLRTPRQGADTILWLAISHSSLKYPSGLFFQDRKSIPTHLPMAWTSSTTAEEDRFMKILDDMAEKFQV